MRLGSAIRHLGALVVFALVAGVVYGPVWRAGADRVVPVPEAKGRGGAEAVRADVIFEVWLASRNARTLATAPQRLFDTEHCAPAEKTLTLGIPMVTLGALAIPAFLASGDPLFSWNATLVLLSLITALGMYALVVSWTGSAGAGIAAGLLYAFHPVRLATVSYPTVWDGVWTVFALLFAERWLSRGRWRDAVGLAAATVLQIGASFYPLVAALLVGLPFLAWLLHRDGLVRVSGRQVAFVAGCIALAAACLLGPYLFARTGIGDGELTRQEFFYAPLRDLAPGGFLFPGWSVLALAAFCLAARRGRILPGIRGDPRWALLVGAVLATLVALGDRAAPLPNLHELLAVLLPGLDAVRVVLRVFSGALLALVLLAGIGAGALVRWGGRARPALAVGLVLVCAFDVLRAPPLGVERPYRWTLEEIRPDPEEIAFFAKLAELGNAGPLLEMPLDPSGEAPWISAPRILLSLYHRRRTSTCFGSYPPPGREDLSALAARLPEPGAVDALAALGFTTVIFRHPRDRPVSYAQVDRFGREAEQGRGIAHVYSTRSETAFALMPTSER